MTSMQMLINFTTTKDCRSKDKPHEPFYPPKERIGENYTIECGDPRVSFKCLERKDETNRSRERKDEEMRELRIEK